MHRFFYIILIILASCSQSKSFDSFTIGRDPSWYPLHFGKMTASLNAYTNGLIQAIADEENAPFHIIDTDWSQLILGLENKLYPCILTSITPDNESNLKYSFSDPFLNLGPVLIVPIDSEATSLRDLHENLIGINQFDDSILLVQQYPTILVQTYQNMPTALDDLVEGSLDAVLMNRLEAETLVSHLFSDRLKIVTPPLTNKALRMATLKNRHKNLIKQFNLTLTHLEKSGKKQALEKEFLFNL